MPSQQIVITTNEVQYLATVEYDIELESIVYPLGEGYGVQVEPMPVNLRVTGVNDIIIRHPSGDPTKAAGVDPPNAGADMDNLLAILTELVEVEDLELSFIGAK